VFVIAAAVAALAPGATIFLGPAWWSTTLLPIGVWLLIGASGLALVAAGGQVRRFGTALITGDALGNLLSLITFFVVFLFAYGRCETCG
jgi:hypothetical protein